MQFLYDFPLIAQLWKIRSGKQFVASRWSNNMKCKQQGSKLKYISKDHLSFCKAGIKLKDFSGDQNKSILAGIKIKVNGIISIGQSQIKLLLKISHKRRIGSATDVEQWMWFEWPCPTSLHARKYLLWPNIHMSSVKVTWLIIFAYPKQ